MREIGWQLDIQKTPNFIGRQKVLPPLSTITHPYDLLNYILIFHFIHYWCSSAFKGCGSAAQDSLGLRKWQNLEADLSTVALNSINRSSLFILVSKMALRLHIKSGIQITIHSWKCSFSQC